MEDTKSFLGRLLGKKGYVIKSQGETGMNFSSASKEVDRQIKQTGGDISGINVTKSGKED